MVTGNYPRHGYLLVRHNRSVAQGQPQSLQVFYSSLSEF